MRVAIVVLAAGVLLAGCEEKLTTPGQCPALCPGGESQVFDEVIEPITGADSSFRGYIQPYQSHALLVSNGLLGFEERGVIRFSRRPDSVGVRDTLRAYTVDSVVLGLSVVARDTSLNGVQVELYRLPPLIDSTTTYTALDPAFVPSNLVATIGLPDTVNFGPIRTLLQGADLATVAIPPADSGVLALGVRVVSPTPTGLRLGSIAAGTGATFTTYATLDVPDTGTAKLRTLGLSPQFNSSLAAVPQADDSTVLAVGGAPSARALLRFALPPRIRDSATIVRATLELTPVTTITGLPSDPVRLEARTVLADLGAKSPLGSALGRVPADTIPAGTSGLISMEAVRLVQLWQGTPSRPSALMLSLAPELESASFSSPVFYSSRAADPALRPRLHISYLLEFPFEKP
ncbi:MAG TPA: hypothetical protein VGN76_07995 [Gemmatimonadales bacterium]|nr:hypothetical protein [Gemmatimonadales bacterium]